MNGKEKKTTRAQRNHGKSRGAERTGSGIGPKAEEEVKIDSIPISTREPHEEDGGNVATVFWDRAQPKRRKENGSKGLHGNRRNNGGFRSPSQLNKQIKKPEKGSKREVDSSGGLRRFNEGKSKRLRMKQTGQPKRNQEHNEESQRNFSFEEEEPFNLESSIQGIGNNPFLTESSPQSPFPQNQAELEDHRESPSHPTSPIAIFTQTIQLSIYDSGLRQLEQNGATMSLNVMSNTQPFLPSFEVTVETSLTEPNPFDPAPQRPASVSGFIRMGEPYQPQPNFPMNPQPIFSTIPLALRYSSQNDIFSMPTQPSFSNEINPFLVPFFQREEDDNELSFNGISAENIRNNKSYSAEITPEEMAQCAHHNAEICSICLSEYIPRNSIQFPCKAKHVFHAICLLHWAEERKPVFCPLCREPQKKPN